MMTEQTKTKDLHSMLSDMEDDICALGRLATALDLMGQAGTLGDSGPAISQVAFIAVQTADRVKAAWLSAFEMSVRS